MILGVILGGATAPPLNLCPRRHDAIFADSTGMRVGLGLNHNDMLKKWGLSGSFDVRGLSFDPESIVHTTSAGYRNTERICRFWVSMLIFGQLRKNLNEETKLSFPNLKIFGRRGAIRSVVRSCCRYSWSVCTRGGGGGNSVVRWAGGWANLAAPYDGQQLM